MTDIVERLRAYVRTTKTTAAIKKQSLMFQAAAEIERLRKREANLVTANIMSDGGAYDAALHLLLALMEKHFPDRKIEPLEDTVGVITQIDNLTTALSRRSDALEEAAKVAVERRKYGTATAIRALKEKS